MKKLIATLLTVACASQAHAVITVDPTVGCTGMGDTRQCSQSVSCSVANECTIEVTTQQNATCTPDADLPSPTLLVADVITGGSPAQCTWAVTEAGFGPVFVTLDGSNGFPVELESFSVE